MAAVVIDVVDTNTMVLTGRTSQVVNYAFISSCRIQYSQSTMHTTHTHDRLDLLMTVKLKLSDSEDD